MTTSSPGFQRVTPAPTFQTIPEASEPPMWWPYCGWSPYENTLTGLPSAAQTLLKFTPAAITRTMTSKAPGSGTSISSTWKACSGSPSRSGRMTHAAIVAGSSPGSVSTWEIWLRSTATCSFLARFGGRDLTRGRQEPGPPEPDDHADQRHDRAGDSPHREGGERPDAVGHPLEVLAEEPHHVGQRQEDRRDHRQPGDDLVEAVGVRRRIEPERVADAVAQTGDPVVDALEVIGDVAK